MEVLIIGYGVIGKATHSVIGQQEHNVTICDPHIGYNPDTRGPFDVVLGCTPCEDGRLDIEELLGRIITSNIIIRSTVLPDTLSGLEQTLKDQDRASINVYHWPEFLTEATAQKDALNPDKLVIGTRSGRHPMNNPGRDNDRALFRQLLGPGQLNNAIWVTPEASALGKLAINNYYALKVLFHNVLWDMAGNIHVDYHQVTQILEADQRITLSHSKIDHGEHRGFGGKCLPKDWQIAASAADSQPVREFYQAAWELNEAFKESTT